MCNIYNSMCGILCGILQHGLLLQYKGSPQLKCELDVLIIYFGVRLHISFISN